MRVCTVMQARQASNTGGALADVVRQHIAVGILRPHLAEIDRQLAAVPILRQLEAIDRLLERRRPVDNLLLRCDEPRRPRRRERRAGPRLPKAGFSEG